GRLQPRDTTQRLRASRTDRIAGVRVRPASRADGSPRTAYHGPAHGSRTIRTTIDEHTDDENTADENTDEGERHGSGNRRQARSRLRIERGAGEGVRDGAREGGRRRRPQRTSRRRPGVRRAGDPGRDG